MICSNRFSNIKSLHKCLLWGLPKWHYWVKNLPANSGDIRHVGLIPGLGRFPGEGHGNSLQYFCLENPMDRVAWQTIQFIGSQRAGHDWGDWACKTIWTSVSSFKQFTTRKWLCIINTTFWVKKRSHFCGVLLLFTKWAPTCCLATLKFISSPKWLWVGHLSSPNCPTSNGDNQLQLMWWLSGLVRGMLYPMDLPGDSLVKSLPANAGDAGSIPGSGKIPWRRKWQSTPH